MKEDVASILSDVYSEAITIKSAQSSAGGSINQAQVLLLSNGEKVFLKSNPCPPENFFAREAKGLTALAQADTGMRVPKVLALDTAPNPHFIILERLEEVPPNGGYYQRFGQMLAKLHQTSQEKFGFDHDNFIGSTWQINALESDGLYFFREHRIRYQQKLARSAEKLPTRLDKRLDQLCDKLGSLLNLGTERPALLHGDLWSGNHFPSSGQTPCMFDPAVYYGPREADLAMTELFGGMPETFYSAYREAFPLDPGYHERKKIYNLYHLLNHLNLFGDAYLVSVEATVNQFI